MVNFNATLIAQVLNFLILVFILAKFAYKPLMKIMDDRKNKIAGDLAAAETAKTDAESIKAEYAAKLAAARQEAQAIIDNARKTAQTAHDKILADTKAEQDQIVKTAKEAIALEKKQALSEIRAHVINLSLVAASKIVEQKLGSEEDKKLCEDIKQFRANEKNFSAEEFRVRCQKRAAEKAERERKAMEALMDIRNEPLFAGL